MFSKGKLRLKSIESWLIFCRFLENLTSGAFFTWIWVRVYFSLHSPITSFDKVILQSICGYRGTLAPKIRLPKLYTTKIFWPTIVLSLEVITLLFSHLIFNFVTLVHFMKYLNNHLMKSPTFPAHQRGLQKKLTKIFTMVVKLIRTSYRGY